MEFESRNEKFGKGMHRGVDSAPRWLIGALVFLVVTGVLTYLMLRAIS